MADLAQDAFAAGREWYRTGQHSSGVANARVVRYGFLKWWNEQSPSRTAGHSRAKSGKLERAFREGWVRAKQSPNSRRHTRRTNPAKYKITVWHGEGKSLFYVLRNGTVVKTFHNRPDAQAYIDKQTSAVGHYFFDKSRVSHGPFKTKKERAAARRSMNPGGPLDTHAAKELELFVENDADLYRQQYTPINKNLITKMARGVYDHNKAVKLFGYLTESGAKKYARQYSVGSDWHQIFSPATRKHVAEIFARHFEVEAKLGNYDSLLPKKYSDWRLKKNPNHLVDVIVKKNGQTFKAKAKYDVAQRRVRVFVNPRVAKTINPSSLQRYDVVIFKLGRKKGERGIDPGWFYGKNVWDYPLGGPYKTKTLAKKAARAAGHSPDPIGVRE